MFLQNISFAKLNMHTLFPLFFEILFQPNVGITRTFEPILEKIEIGFISTRIHLQTE